MRFLLLGAVAVLALGGCHSQRLEDEANWANAANAAAAPAPTPVAMLGTVNLAQPVRAFGTEPYWTLDIAPGEMTFTDHGTKDLADIRYYPVAPTIAGDTATYTTKSAAGDAVVITLTVKECLEAGEPEDAVPLTAVLKIGTRTLRGCAGPRPAPEPEPVADNASNATS